jgi:hypothetical protein
MANYVKEKWTLARENSRVSRIDVWIARFVDLDPRLNSHMYNIAMLSSYSNPAYPFGLLSQSDRVNDILSLATTLKPWSWKSSSWFTPNLIKTGLPCSPSPKNNNWLKDKEWLLTTQLDKPHILVVLESIPSPIHWIIGDISGLDGIWNNVIVLKILKPFLD